MRLKIQFHSLNACWIKFASYLNLQYREVKFIISDQKNPTSNTSLCTMEHKWMYSEVDELK